MLVILRNTQYSIYDFSELIDVGINEIKLQIYNDFQHHVLSTYIIEYVFVQCARIINIMSTQHTTDSCMLYGLIKFHVSLI